MGLSCRLNLQQIVGSSFDEHQYQVSGAGVVGADNLSSEL